MYKAGGRASALYAALGAPDCPGQAELAARYIAELKQQSAVLLGGTMAASLVPLEYNGDLNWYWTDGISFNALTYNYISGGDQSERRRLRALSRRRRRQLRQPLPGADQRHRVAVRRRRQRRHAAGRNAEPDAGLGHRASLHVGLRPADGGADAGGAGVQRPDHAADRLHPDVPCRVPVGRQAGAAAHPDHDAERREPRHAAAIRPAVRGPGHPGNSALPSDARGERAADGHADSRRLHSVPDQEEFCSRRRRPTAAPSSSIRRARTTTPDISAISPRPRSCRLSPAAARR